MRTVMSYCHIASHFLVSLSTTRTVSNVDIFSPPTSFVDCTASKVLVTLNPQPNLKRLNTKKSYAQAVLEIDTAPSHIYQTSNPKYIEAHIYGPSGIKGTYCLDVTVYKVIHGRNVTA